MGVGCRPLTKAETNAVAQGFTRERDKLLFIMGTLTGLRISSLLSLRVRDVFQNGEVMTEGYVSKGSMKGRPGGATFFIHPFLKVQIFSYIMNELQRGGNGVISKKQGEITPETFLFQSGKGINRPISRIWAWRILKSCFFSSGVTGKTGTHSMRKTFAANMYEQLDGDIVLLQKALRHANLDSTVYYLSFKEEEVTDAINKLDIFSMDDKK